MCWRYSLFPLFHRLPCAGRWWRWASWSLCQSLRGCDLCLSLWHLQLTHCGWSAVALQLWPPPSHFPAAPSSKATRNVTAGRRTSPFIKSAHWALLLITGNWWCVDLVPRSIKELKIDSHLTYVGVNVSWLNGTINGLVLQVQCWNRCDLVTFDNVRRCSWYEKTLNVQAKSDKF